MSNQKRFALIGTNIGPIDKSDALADGDILVYNASTGKWVSQAFSATSALSEAVQDIVGAMATDNTDINFTYDDGAGTLVAAILEAGVTQHEAAIDHDALLNFVANEHIDWTSTSSNFANTGTFSAGPAGAKIAASGTEVDLTATTLDFNGAADFSSTVTVNSVFSITNASAARAVFTDSAAGSNQKIWEWNFDDGNAVLLSRSDVGAFVESAITAAKNTSGEVTLVAIAGDEIALTATTLDFNGACNIAGGLNAEPESRSISASETTAATDQGIVIRLTGGSGQTLTLDGDPPTDATVVIDNSAGAAWTIAASGTLIWADTAGTGSRTLADDGLAVAIHRGSGVWIINGGGLS